MSKVIGLRADDALYQALNDWAMEQGVSRSEAAATLLSAALGLGSAEELVHIATVRRLYGVVQRRMPALYDELNEAVARVLLAGPPPPPATPRSNPSPVEPTPAPAPMEGQRSGRTRRGRRGGRR